MPKKSDKSDIRGIFVPIATCFKGRFGTSLDSQALTRLVNYLIANGVDGIMPLGTSGEFGLLNRTERREVIRTSVETSKGRVPVVAGVSSSGTDNAIRLAKDAEEVRADVVISTGPYYYRTNSEGLLLHFQSIIDEVSLPLMIYNIPSWAGYNIPAEVVEKLADRNPGRIIGVKFTTNDLGEFLSYLRLLRNRMSIMIGSDELIFSALELGAAGAVVGSANVLPRETADIYENFSRGDFEKARSIQAKIDPFTQTMVLGTYPAGVKAALDLIGLSCGPVRRPLLNLSAKEISKVKASLGWKLKQID
jgi:4-hydroxy-tetrahydrodipicolinate synthase